MHLIELYAKDLGVKIGRPKITSHFFPITHRDYITIHNDNKIPSKEYKYWDDVISLFKEKCDKYKFVQVGSYGEKRITLADEHWPTTSLKQLFYIIKHSKAHVGIDSVPVHIASHYNKPTVSLYSHTYANTCKPYWNSKYIALESNRDGKLPSFSLNEDPHYIDKIYPDKIAQSLLDILDIDKTVSQKTLYIGNKYGIKIFDVIPLKDPVAISGDINVRMDLFHNEEILLKCLNRFPCEITINRPLNSNILLHKNIKFINYISARFDENFTSALKKSGKNFSLLCSDRDSLNDERAKFFDFIISPYLEEEIIQSSTKSFLINAKENHDDINEENFKFSISSTKIYVCGDDRYFSKYDFNGKKDTNDLWVDIDWMKVYLPTHEE